MSIESWEFVRIHPHGQLHFTEDGQSTHCGFRLRENSITAKPPAPETQAHCRRCLRWYNIYQYMLEEEHGDVQAARQRMQNVSH